MRQLLFGAIVALGFGVGPASAQWQTVVPGGDTLCSDGSPYQFYVHPGDPSRLIIEFEGGGACWSAETCGIDIYNRRIEIGPEEARQQGLLQGIYDRDNPANPVRDWTHVYIPYCTGDIHWGLKDQTYQGPAGPYTIHHRGAANAGAAVAWAFENIAGPERVLVTGCSAGGYGSIMWAPRVLDRYPAATVSHLADSASGVMPDNFLGVLRSSWGVEAIWPEQIPGLSMGELDPNSSRLTDLYDGIAAHYPLATFSQFNTTFDSTQILFSILAQGANVTPETWSASMQASIAHIEALNPNFRSYTAPGTEHCIINKASFYTTMVSGTPFTGWLTQLVATGGAGSVR